jgi:phosphatidylinositol glycan class F
MPLIDPVTMSSAITKTTKAQMPANSPKESTEPSQSHPLHPTHILPSPAAQTAKHALPALQLAIFLIRFDSLVEHPVPTLWTSLPLVILIQAAYAYVCLPVAGSGRGARKHRPGERKKEGGSNVYVAVLLSLLLSLSITPFLHIVMMLFGAPVLTHLQHTLLCASHLSILTLFPLFYVHGVDPASWLAVAGFRAPFDETFGGFVGGVVGAWLGAVPIPLDWDREWQKWPVTVLCGIYIGYLLGKTIGGTPLAFGKKF